MEKSELGVSGRPSSLEDCERQTTDGLDQQYETYLNLYGGRKRGHYDQQAQTDLVGTDLNGIDREVSFKNTAVTQSKPKTQRDGLPPPGPFEGKNTEDAETWIKNFALWAEIRQYDDDSKLQVFPYLLKGVARTWFETQKSSNRDDWETLAGALL